MGAYKRGRPPKYDAMSDTGRKPPKAAGEYRIKDANNQIKYLGISNDLDRRIKEHKKNGKINESDRFVEWMAAVPDTSYDTLRDHERQKIKIKQPYANKTSGGEGPVPKHMRYFGEDWGSGMPDFSSQPQPQSSGGGCYIATCVYGSYDCPEVWTLRRYRDYKLSETLPGRVFIKIYYAISPTIVKVFGNTLWFRRMFRGYLDKKANRLNTMGFENTPYRDHSL